MKVQHFLSLVAMIAPASATTLLVNLQGTQNRLNLPAAVAADYAANDAAVDLGATVNVKTTAPANTFGAFTVTSSGGGFFASNKGSYRTTPILGSYNFNTSDTVPITLTIDGLATIPAGQMITLTLYGVGDSNAAGGGASPVDAEATPGSAGFTGTSFSTVYNGAAVLGSTDYVGIPFIQQTFVSDGVDNDIVISWTKLATGDTSGFNGFSLTSVPGPSVALLAGLGLFGLLRRCRN